MNSDFLVLIESDEGNDWAWVDSHEQAVETINNLETSGKYYILDYSDRSDINFYGYYKAPKAKNVKCLQCEHEFETKVYYEDDLGYFATCPECGGSFDVDIDENEKVCPKCGSGMKLFDHEDADGNFTKWEWQCECGHCEDEE